VAETLPLPPDLAQTLEACMRTLSADVTAGVERNPNSTITPAQHTPDPEMAAAIELLRQMGPELGADKALDIEGTLGEGGMGVVRLATQRSVGRKVALKTLRDGIDSKTAAAKLLYEGWTTGALEHPNVVPVYDVGTSKNGTPFIVLKRIEGEHWGQIMTNAAAVEERFGVTNLVEWNLRTLMQVCNAVHFAHRRGIVHRDLKPENVMIGQFGEVYVVDWGIAVSLRDDEGGRLPLASRTTRLAGTPCYMPPETIAEEIGPIAEVSDVYLLGAVLFEILTGHPPHEGSELVAILASVLISDPQLPDEVPKELARICTQAMARRQADRFATAEDFRLALQDYLSHAGSVRLAAGAEQSLERLRAATAGSTDGLERTHLYDLLGECRFGFRSALQAWSGNDDARRGLAAAIAAMTKYELSRGDARSAQLLLSELEERPEDLARQVARALREQEQAERKAEELRQLGASLDPTVGRRTRVAAGTILGVFWTAAPIIGHYSMNGGRDLTSRSALILDASVFLIMGALFIWARDSLTRSVFNRRVNSTVAVAMLLKTSIDLWVMWQERPPEEGLRAAVLLFSAVAAVTAIHLGWKLLPLAFAYLGVVALSELVPGSILLGLSGANLVLTLCMLWIWLPNRRLGRGFWGDESPEVESARGGDRGGG
jgi:serine/threonine-protein kinase